MCSWGTWWPGQGDMLAEVLQPHAPAWGGCWMLRLELIARAGLLIVCTSITKVLNPGSLELWCCKSLPGFLTTSTGTWLGYFSPLEASCGVEDGPAGLKMTSWLTGCCLSCRDAETSVLSPGFVSSSCSSLNILSLWSLSINKNTSSGQLTTWDFSNERENEWILLSRGHRGLQTVLKGPGGRKSYLMLNKWQLFENAVSR